MSENRRELREIKEIKLAYFFGSLLGRELF